MTVCAHILPATGNTTDFAVQTVTREAFKAFSRVVGVGSVAQLIFPQLWLGYGLGAFPMLGSFAKGDQQLKQCSYLQDNTRPTLNVPGLEWAALRGPRDEHEAFCFLTYMFISHCTASYLLLEFVG